MKEEIKEILDFIKKQIEKETLSYEPDVELSKEEAKLLLDYITNLQEENEKVHKELDYADNYNIYLISKIDKAIEYINKLSNEPNAFGHYGIDGNCKKYLLNILKGDKDE